MVNSVNNISTFDSIAALAPLSVRGGGGGGEMGSVQKYGSSLLYAPLCTPLHVSQIAYQNPKREAKRGWENYLKHRLRSQYFRQRHILAPFEGYYYTTTTLSLSLSNHDPPYPLCNSPPFRCLK